MTRTHHLFRPQDIFETALLIKLPSAFVTPVTRFADFDDCELYTLFMFNIKIDFALA